MRRRITVGFCVSDDAKLRGTGERKRKRANQEKLALFEESCQAIL